MNYRKLKCKNGHKKLAVQVINEEEDWIEVYCPTCFRTVWYNGA
jgi:hypothetical protein